MKKINLEPIKPAYKSISPETLPAVPKKRLIKEYNTMQKIKIPEYAVGSQTIQYSEKNI